MGSARTADGGAAVGQGGTSGSPHLLPDAETRRDGPARFLGQPSEPLAAGRPARTGPVALSMVAVLLLLTTGGYLGVTWARAQEVCAEEVAVHRDQEDAPSTVDVDWSWHPVGIRCTWGDDGSWTSLWWGGHRP